MPQVLRSRRRAAVSPSRLRLRDLGSEALAGLLQRPGRSVLTLIGVVLGIGSFVAIVGIAQTASGQIGKQFNVLQATQAYVFDVGGGHTSGAAAMAGDFPPDADALAERIHGVVAAGVYWQVEFDRAAVSALRSGLLASRRSLPVTAASPGLLAAAGAKLASGTFFNQFHEAHAQNVALLGQSAAASLGISSLQSQPAIFINGQPFTVIGIIARSQRLPQLDVGATVPESAALRLWGSPRRGSAQMLIHTSLGAARVVAQQAAVAIRPDDPASLRGAAAPSVNQLKHSVSTSLNSLYLTLAGIALIVGAVGIANTTLVAVLERAGEIGLRRALGARPRHIGVQFLAESTALGLFGGLIGSSLGVAAVLGITIYQHWTALLDPRIVLAAPAAGAVVGLLAGLYPALRASALEPAAALRR
jgi:putative ABC transport system permease protein